jgi:hypothetical protein
VIPSTERISLPEKAAMGVAIDGSASWWPEEKKEAQLPALSKVNRSTYIDLFNRGKTPYNFSIKTSADWLVIFPKSGRIKEGQRIEIRADWRKVPHGKQYAKLIISGGSDNTVEVNVAAENFLPDHFTGFAENNGYVSIQADHYSKVVNRSSIQWERIPGIGKNGSGMNIQPVTAGAVQPSGGSPHLEYPVFFHDTGHIFVYVSCSPTLGFNGDTLRYAVSFDDEAPQTVNILSDHSNKKWMQWVADNINISSSIHEIRKPGMHVLKYWMIDPGIVVQKIILDCGGLKETYFGPPETDVRDTF